jgi:transketolase
VPEEGAILGRAMHLPPAAVDLMDISHLRKEASEIRRHVLGMCHRANASHVGSGLSCADILTVLYLGGILRIDPAKPLSPNRDIFLLSKGHASAALYATLARAGFFPTAELDSYYMNGSHLPGHPSRGCMPGVEASTGSLGHGLGLGCGMALAARLDKKPTRVFVLLSDGELDEGSVWEAVLFAGAKKLTNLVAIVDYNKIQSFGRVAEVLDLEPLEDKVRAFGWEVRRTDGNSVEGLHRLLSSGFLDVGKPKMIIADTVKGKGVSFMEDRLEWHYKSPSAEQYAQAVGELPGLKEK